MQLDVGLIAYTIATLAIGALLGVIGTEYVKRPMPRLGGGGGGGDRRYRQTNLRIMNAPGYVGLNIGWTMLFGKPLQRGIRRGLDVERNPITNCRALLVDPVSNKGIAWLHWRSPEDTSKFVTTTMIPNGESRELMLFARLETEPGRYFPFEPDMSVPSEIVVPDEHRRFGPGQAFILRILYGVGREATAHVRVGQATAGGGIAFTVTSKLGDHRGSI